MTGRSLRAISAPSVFLLFFSYATAAALLFQKFLLPLIAAVHHGQGLVEGDSVYFHKVASDLADRILAQGWSEWQVYPAQGATGNVAVLAALYALFGKDPSLVVPLNAAIHAYSGTLLFLLGRMLWPGRIGTLSGLIAGTLFVVFPSALNWYGQIHKDGYAIAGTLMVLFAWVLAESAPPGRRQALLSIAALLVGSGLVVFVRPYNLMLIFGGMLVLSFLRLAYCWQGRGKCATDGRLYLQAAIVVLIGMATYLAPRTGTDEQRYPSWQANKFQWSATDWIPRPIDRYAEVMARTRAGLIYSGLSVQAGSLYDSDRLPASTPQLAAYAPRALQIALFAPFPTRWFEKLSATRLVAVGEMAIWYLVAPGLLMALWFARSRGALSVVVFALALLTVYGITLANLGTLYRVRYLCLFLLLLVGLAGWLGLLERLGWLPKPRGDPGEGRQEVKADAALRQARAELVGSGITVAAVTAVSFLGLFIRDIVMARMFGLGVELDAFVAATVVPMFLVAVLSVPIGTAIVAVYLEVRERRSAEAAQALARRVGLLFFVCALVLAGLLAMLGPRLLEAGDWDSLTEKADLTRAIMLWMLAIFVFSGLVTLANGLLNALGHYVVPAAAQVIVPVFAIAALLLFGKAVGAIVVAVAMFAGQLVNLALVYRTLSRQGVSLLRARSTEAPGTASFVSQYLPLVAAAVFLQIALPVSTAMASRLPAGSVAALGLGSKAVLFLTGLIGAAITSVVLPYFSRHLAQNRLLDARRELSFLLLAGTVLSIPLAVALHLLAGPFVRLVFEGGTFGLAESGLVSRVMAYGILQLPFFLINLLLLKFAIASRHTGRVMLAAGVGLVVLLLLNLSLMNRIGVPGIALSMTLTAAVTAGLMLLLFCRLGDVAWVDMAFIAINWILFLALTVCLHYGSYPGAFAAGLAFVSLITGEWKLSVRPREDGAART